VIVVFVLNPVFNHRKWCLRRCGVVREALAESAERPTA
jgi:hypothetical protein